MDGERPGIWYDSVRGVRNTRVVMKRQLTFFCSSHYLHKCEVVYFFYINFLIHLFSNKTCN